MSSKISIEDYIELLDDHDWAYHYTEDPRVWRKEEAKRIAIRNIAYELKGDYEKEYKRRLAKGPKW